MSDFYALKGEELPLADYLSPFYLPLVVPGLTSFSGVGKSQLLGLGLFHQL